jgi:hypothetical protein
MCSAAVLTEVREARSHSMNVAARWGFIWWIRLITFPAEHFANQHGTLDVLMCNAGIMALPPGQTADGYEIFYECGCEMGIYLVDSFDHFSCACGIAAAEVDV